MKRKVHKFIFLSLVISLILAGCSENKEKDAPVPQEHILNDTVTNESQVIQENQTLQQGERLSSKKNNEVITSGSNLVKGQSVQDGTIKEVDKEEYFDGIKGCMVIYDEEANEYLIYNKELANTQSSPYSTFKIMAALIGLQEGVLLSGESTMGYDGTRYPMDSWNKDLTLEEAFKSSCVWYFRKVINEVGLEKMTQYVKDFHYGNEDVSEWKGKESDSPELLKGFWLNSSLKISPKEQVDVLHTLFAGENHFSDENKELVKKIMYTDAMNGYEVYGKTGTGNDKAWFVGFFQNEEKTYYFAVQLEEGQGSGINGYKARTIAYNVIQGFNTKEEVKQ